ncbi:MAG: flagellar export protein FliJ [Chloroflexota bacterium]
MSGGGFRLGVVLRLREMAEDAARARLATAVDAHRLATEELIARTAAEHEAQGRVMEMAEAGAQAGEIRAARAGIETAEAATKMARAKLEKASEGLMVARSALAEASKRREVVERLRDRIRQVEARDAQHREDNQLSEIAGVRHARALGTREVEP